MSTTTGSAEPHRFSSLSGEEGERFDPRGRLTDWSYAGYHAGEDPRFPTRSPSPPARQRGCDHPIWSYSAADGCTDPQEFGFFGAASFVSFVLIGATIMLNLFIGVIMTSKDEARAESDRPALADSARREITSHGPR